MTYLAEVSASGVGVFLFLVYALIFGVVCGSVYRNKGGSYASGFALGFFLGLIGLIVVTVLTPQPQGDSGLKRQCPWCKEGMQPDASVCPHCQRESEPWERRHGIWTQKDPEGRTMVRDPKGNWRRLRSGSACPYCAQTMTPKADKCPNCQQKSNPVTA